MMPIADGFRRLKAVTCKKGGRSYMSYFSCYCPEIQNYLRACEHLLAAARNNQQFSEEELQMVESYALDVANLHTAFVSGKTYPVTLSTSRDHT